MSSRSNGVMKVAESSCRSRASAGRRRVRDFPISLVRALRRDCESVVRASHKALETSTRLAEAFSKRVKKRSPLGTRKLQDAINTHGRVMPVEVSRPGKGNLRVSCLDVR